MELAEKVYVGVLEYVSPEGNKKLLAIKWKDGRKFRIEYASKPTRAASLKAGGVGNRYTCEICGKRVFVYDEEGRYFMEGKVT